MGSDRFGKIRRFGSPVLRFIFGRSMLTVLLLFVQIFYLVAGFLWLGEYMNILMEVLTVLSALIVIYIINSDDNPAYKIAWMVPILVLPVLGTLLYIFVQLDIGHRMLHKVMKANIAATEKWMDQNREEEEALFSEDAYAGALAHYLFENGRYPVYSGCDAVYFPDGKSKIDELLKQLEQAERFIFMEYFIVDAGNVWDRILDVLKRKAAQGVEVRFLYDGMCSLILLPFQYPKRLAQFGIQAKMYAPIYPLLSTHQNNRDHRKIVVIDGHTAFTGGINLADEYTNEKELYGYWKDASIMVKGDCVKSFTALFLQMWNANRKQGIEDYGKYLEALPLKHSIQNGFMIPYGDGPYEKEPIAENVYLHIIQTAKRYVHIMTPYLILDHEVISALKYAAKRGVDVKLILPHIPDKKIPFDIARSYYKELIPAGVKIYEFTPGFVHAKVFTADDICAVVGSINLDYRSLYLHFEDAVYLYHTPVVGEIEKDFQETLLKSQEVTLSYYYEISFFKRMAGWLFRLFGPLM